jgi:hypothetical protein
MPTRFPRVVRRRTQLLLVAILLPALPAAAQQSDDPQLASDWSAVQTITVGQEVRAIAATKEIRGRFQSASEHLLVLSRGSRIVYLDRSDIQQVATVSRPARHHKWTTIGAAVGFPWGFTVAISAGLKGVPITMGMFAGIGALIDLSNDLQMDRTERIVTVYSAP